MLTGLVLSDLHLLSKRSIGENLLQSIGSRIDAAHTLVLNGDTFDFQWCEESDIDTAIASAISFLRRLLSDLRQDQDLLFMLGNHDCLSLFVDQLTQLAAQERRLTVKAETYSLGRNLFLHGDPANRKMTNAGLEKERERWKTESRRPTPIHLFFQFADRLQISPFLHRFIFPPTKTMERIAYYLDDHHPSWEKEFDTVFFGHTHCVLDQSHRGVRFVNTGSGIPQMGFNPVEFEF